MNELELKQYVETNNNRIFTTSRKVAERFGKQHKNVLQIIKKLEPQVGRLIFKPISYVDESKREYVEYEMTRDGFMLLAMRFTGEEALKVQIAFVDAFSKMEEFIRGSIVNLDHESKRLRTIPVAEPVFKSLKNVALEFGLEGNQALLYANKATLRETGVDFQTTLQIEMKNEKQERFFTPTELGSRLNLSAIKFNQELSKLGLQEKRNNQWAATEFGKKYSVLLDAGKKHSDGTPIQQLKWFESVMNLLRCEAIA